MTSVETLPHWDVSTIFPGLDSPEFLSQKQHLTEALNQLTQSCDQLGIERRDHLPVNELTVDAFEQVAGQFNQLFDQFITTYSYTNSFIATDSTNAKAQAHLSELQQLSMRLQLLSTRLIAWIGSLDVEALIEQSAFAAEHAFMLRQSALRAQHLMSPAEEELATALGLTGSTAWSKLYNNFTSQIMVAVDLPDGPKDLPMTAVRNLAFDAQRSVRQAGYEAEVAAWKRHALPIAAALNSLKGETNTLSRRRGWEHPLDKALFDNSIDRDTLDTMLAAARERFPVFRRYFRAKAQALGLEQLAWFDLFAPVGTAGRVWHYDQATQFITEQFYGFSHKLGNLAERAFQENWIDAEPRPGKVGGAFCMPIRPGESRILSNYKPNFVAVSTLAHELGHAYHNLNLGQRTPMQRQTPMTLAETASTFCETIITHAALKLISPEEQITIIEASLQDASQVVVDITSRFQFEHNLFDRRQQRELSPDELCELMLQAQRDTYGDGLDQNYLHPYMWAVKPHYYGSTFYNFPYMFGLLFSLGLYARYQQDPASFVASYDDLLSSTGMDNAAELASRFGIDTRSPAFWRGSFDVIEQDIVRFEQLVGA